MLKHTVTVTVGKPMENCDGVQKIFDQVSEFDFTVSGET